MAGAPAQAANTAGEEFGVDTNADGVDDAREFAGAHRYETAEKLARRFAADAGGVSSVVIASGEGSGGDVGIDALTAAGLAGSMGAPVLLTRRAMLPHGVARFINDQNVTSVTVVGGTAAVSDAVVNSIEGLGSKPKVKRVSGSDRYATAAMIGGELGGPSPTWCGSTQRAAILVNGGAAGRSDAIVAGPLANRLGLPMLLTEADELPAVTRKFLTDNRVERVVVVGNAEAVAGSLINTLIEDVGVTEAPRIAGATAAATSVEVAKTMRDACKTELSTDLDRVALVSQTATADGIAAAPVLGRGLGNTGSIPILLVGSDLPAEVGDFLKTTPNDRGAGANKMKTDLKIVAVGGTAVVSEAVMAAAIEAATTSDDLTATISFDPATAASRKQFKVTFSDAVVDTAPTSTQASAVDPGLYRVNGRRLSAEASNQGGTNEGARPAKNLLLLGREVTVTLNDELKTGDKIEVIGGAQVGAAGDKRKLKTAEFTVTVPAAAQDRTAPKVEVFSVAGRTQIDIWVYEPNLLQVPSGNGFRIEGGKAFRFGGGITAKHCPTATTCTDARINRVAGPYTGISSNTQAANQPGSDGKGGGISRFFVELQNAQGARIRTQANDMIEIARGTFLDTGNRGNALVRYTVPAHPSGFRFTGLVIGNKQPTRAASVDLAADANTNAGKLRVTAKQTGIAKGSAGNGWTIFGYKLPTAVGSKPVDIEVDVDTRTKTISYTVRNGTPTVGDLAKAFAADSDFAANFTFDYKTPGAAGNPALTAALGTISTASRTLTGGKSAIAVRVDYNDIVWQVTGAATILAAQIMGQSSVPGSAMVGGVADGGVTVQAITNDAIAFDKSIWLSYESGERRKETRLPTRTGTKVLTGGAASGQSYHPTSDNVAGAVFRGMRLDPSLQVCPIRDNAGAITSTPPCVK